MALRQDCVYIFPIFFSILLGNVRSNDWCPPGFKYVESILPKDPVCVAYFKTPETWERAYNICRHYSSYLFYYEATDIEEIQKVANGTDKIHIGIRRINGIYLWSDPNPREFSHDSVLNRNDWKLLWEKDEPRHDCVGLNLVTKTLYTTSCNRSHHSFVCVGQIFPRNPMVCDDDWEFSYLSGNCIKHFRDLVNFTIATRKCQKLRSQLISSETILALKPTFLFENVNSTKNIKKYMHNFISYIFDFNCSIFSWNGNSAEMIPADCSEQHRYTCQKEIKKLNIEVRFTKDEIPATNLSEFRDIIMFLQVKVNGKDTKNVSKITWWKDNKPIERCANESCIPALYVNTPNVTKQGIYYASVIIPAYPYTVYSKTVEIYLSDVSTYLLNVTGTRIPYKREIHDYSRIEFNEFKEIVDEKMKNLFHNFSIPNLPRPFWYLSSIADTADETSLHIYLYFSFFKRSKEEKNISRPTDEKNDIYRPLRNFINNKVRMMVFADWGRSTVNVTIVGRCFRESKLSNNGINVTWQDSYHSKHIVSSPPCITNGWELVTRTCHGGYMRESKWSEFDYSKCSKKNDMKGRPSRDKCRLSYAYWKYDTCISVHKETTDWFGAQETCGKMKGYLFSPKLNSNMSLWEFDLFLDIGEIWLGGYRNFGMFQWMAFYPGFINTSEVSWGHGEPKINNDCLSGKIFGGKLMLYSRPCHEKRSFVCMHKALNTEFYESPRCPGNWKKWPFRGENCYMHTEEKMTWIETQHYCKEKGGMLAVLPFADQNVVVKDYVRQIPIEPSTWWIGLRKTQNGFIWDNDIDIRYVDWDPTTDFSPNNTAGALVFHGKVTWNVNNPNQKNFGICERKTNRGRAVVQLSEVKKGVFKCVSDRRYYKSVTWYKDGLIVNGTRGLLEADDDILEIYNLLSPQNIHLKTLARLQGYYWCEVDQKTPFISVSSNKKLFINEDFWTFSGEVFSRKILNHFDPSTSKFWNKIEEITKKFEDHLLPKQLFPMSAHIHHLSLENDKTKLMFYIYIERKRNKRAEKNVNRKKYENILEGYIESKLRSSKIAEELQLIPESFKIMNSGECNKDTTVVGGRNLTWNETRSGMYAIEDENCVTENGDPVIRRCLGNFTYGSYWGSVEGTCSGRLSDISEKLKNLSKKTVTNPKQTSENLKILTNDSSQLKAIDLHYVALTMQNIAEVQVHQRDDVQNVIYTMDNIMDMDPDIIVSSKIKVNASSRITASLENILENNIDMLVERRSNLIVYSWPLKSEVAGMMVMSADGDNLGKSIPIMDTGGDKLTDEKCRAGILIPRELVQERKLKNSSIDFIIYKNDSLFLTNNKSSKIITPVLYAHISGGPVLLEKMTIEIVLETFKVPSQIPKSEKCVYWDYSLDNGEGGWSDEGCDTRIDHLDEKHVKCFCDHMTNFAILVDLYGENVEEEDHAIALDIITYIGCTLSIFGLLLTIITFMIFKKLRKGLGSQVLCNLAVSLLLTLIVFLTGIDQISSKMGCIFVAALLHYLLLVSFSWMLVEAVLQYLRFVKVIGTYIPKFMLKASLFAWGFPLLITLTILAIDHNMYHGGKNYCWLKIKPFYFGFLVPVGIIMLSNVVIFCLVIYSISCGRQKGLRTNQSERKLAITRVRAAFCILFLLGLSWTFGFFAVSDARLIFKYLFSIFTTLQGFFIFVFHVLQEKTTRDLWYEYFCLKREHGIQIFTTRDTSTAKETITSSNSISRNKS